MIYSRIKTLKEKLPLIPNDNKYAEFKNQVNKVTERLEHRLKNNKTDAVIFDRNGKDDVKVMDVLIKDRISYKCEKNKSYIIKGYNEIPDTEVIDGEIKVPMRKWDQLKQSVIYISEEDYYSGMERLQKNVDPDVAILVVNHVNEFDDLRIRKFLDNYSGAYEDGNLITLINDAPRVQCNFVESCDGCYPIQRRKYLLKHNVNENRFFKVFSKRRLEFENGSADSDYYNGEYIDHFDDFLKVLQYEMSLEAKEKRLMKDSNTIDAILNNAEGILKHDEEIKKNLQKNGKTIENNKEKFENKIDNVSNGEVANNIINAKFRRSSEEEVSSFIRDNINIIIDKFETELRKDISDVSFANYVMEIYNKEYMDKYKLINNFTEKSKREFKEIQKIENETKSINSLKDKIKDYMLNAGQTIKNSISKLCSTITDNLLKKFKEMKKSIIKLAQNSANNFIDNLYKAGRKYKEELQRISDEEKYSIKEFINFNESRKCYDYRNFIFEKNYMNKRLATTEEKYLTLNDRTNINIDNLFKNQGNYDFYIPLKKTILSILNRKFDKINRYKQLQSELTDKKCYITESESYNANDKLKYENLNQNAGFFTNFFEGWSMASTKRTWWGAIGSGLSGGFYNQVAVIEKESIYRNYTVLNADIMLPIVDSYFPLFKQNELDEMIKCIDKFWSRFNLD